MEVNLVTVEDIRRVAAKYFQQPYVLATVQPPNNR